MNEDYDRQMVHDFWSDASCGGILYLDNTDRAGYDAQANRRYELEPFIHGFSCSDEYRGPGVLAIGVGLGIDHQRFAEEGAKLTGIDLTERAVEHTERRLAACDLSSRLTTGDAECLEFPAEVFDRVFSWGVLHHSPDTPKAVAEVWRVPKAAGEARIMVYHKWSVVGFMLWLRYALFALRPWLTLSQIYARHLESPGTKAYSVREAREMFANYSDVRIRTVLSHGDVLTSEAGQRHQGAALKFARCIWPRWLIRRFLGKAGLFMLIDARK